MTRQSVKQFERRIVEEAGRSLPDFPRGLLVDSESPDFLVLAAGGGSRWGIEVTQLSALLEF